MSPARAPRPAPHLNVVLLLAVLVVGDGEAQGVSGAFDQHQGGALGQRESAVKHANRWGGGADLGPQPLKTIRGDRESNLRRMELDPPQLGSYEEVKKWSLGAPARLGR